MVTSFRGYSTREICATRRSDGAPSARNRLARPVCMPSPGRSAQQGVGDQHLPSLGPVRDSRRDIHVDPEEVAAELAGGGPRNPHAESLDDPAIVPGDHRLDLGADLAQELEHGRVAGVQRP